MNKFKEKQEEWKLSQEKHFKEIEIHMILHEKVAVFLTTDFFRKLPPDLKIYIYPFVIDFDFTSFLVNKYKEMFGVIGNFLYTPELNKKNAKFMIENKET